jgi:hypothetical protein
MRLIVAIFVTGSLANVSCNGDSSAIMSAWNDSGAGNSLGAGGMPQTGGAIGAGGQGGKGGQTTFATGGTGGSIIPAQGGSGGPSGGGTIRVTGGIRDLATTQCISTSGGSCPVSSTYLTCLESNCGIMLNTCYYSDGVSSAAGGVCRSYANCMLACSCDASRSKCENACLENYATANPDCSTCLYNLVGCSSKYNCPTTTACMSASGDDSSGGVPAGSGAAGGSGG